MQQKRLKISPFYKWFLTNGMIFTHEITIFEYVTVIV